MVGFSAGSGLVAKFLGEYPDVLSAAVGVCPGYDIEKCMGRFAYPYQMLLLYLGNLFFLDRNKSLLENVKGYHECKKADDLQKWLSSAHKMAGYTSAEEYYDNCNPMRTVDNIKNPCLFINSEDDPLCVEQNVIESLDDIYRSEHCIVCVTKTGSHLPFYEGLFFNSWATHATYEFFDIVLKEEEEVHIRF